MYRPSDPQKPLFDAAGVLPPQKRELCEESWAGPFRKHALPILRKVEGEFADLFEEDKGRPNRPVALVLGTLILKEMNDLTDEEALSALEFDARWWYAFERELHELHLCQKTLHNFRTGLVKHEKAKLAFRQVTDELVRKLEVKGSQQRIDSTHIVSNIAVLTRLGLLCETIRVFLREVKRVDPKSYEGLPEGMLKRHGEESRYQDARRADGPRRLKVVGRDLWRLVTRFEKHEGVAQGEAWTLLKRLFEEQCVVTTEPRQPGEDEDDHGDGGAPAELKPAGKVGGDSLQTPHDPDVRYSGTKGKGFEVQVVETSTPGNAVQLITEVEVTASSGSDATQTVPLVKAVTDAGHKPQEVVADTAYGGAGNAAALAKEGVNLLAPVPGPEHAKLAEALENRAPEGPCPKEEPAALSWLRQQEASPEFKERYKIRSGIESTNAELKGKHGMKKLRVRGKERVKLSVYFKALACNVKRALKYWLRSNAAAEGAACLG
jgi:hypothetical protein